MKHFLPSNCVRLISILHLFTDIDPGWTYMFDGFLIILSGTKTYFLINLNSHLTIIWIKEEKHHKSESWYWLTVSIISTHKAELKPYRLSFASCALSVSRCLSSHFSVLYTKKTISQSYFMWAVCWSVCGGVCWLFSCSEAVRCWYLCASGVHLLLLKGPIQTELHLVTWAG